MEEQTQEETKIKEGEGIGEEFLIHIELKDEYPILEDELFRLKSRTHSGLYRMDVYVRDVSNKEQIREVRVVFVMRGNRTKRIQSIQVIHSLCEIELCDSCDPETTTVNIRPKGQEDVKMEEEEL